MKNTKRSPKRRVFAMIAGTILIFASTFLLKQIYVPTEASPEFSPESSQTSEKLSLKTVRSNLQAPQSIDFHPPTGRLLMASQSEARLEIISSSAPNRFLTGEIPDIESLAVVRGENSDFETGEIFLGFEKGELWRVSADGSHVSKIKLKGENSAVRGLAVGDGKIFAADGAGRIRRIDGQNRAETIFSAQTPLLGLVAVPADFVRFGPLAGKLLAGAPELGGIFILDERGSAVFYPLNFRPADLDLIAEKENLFGTNRETGRIFQISAEYFTNSAGGILITSAGTSEFCILKWNGAELATEIIEISEKIDQTAFAPLDLSENAGGNCVSSLSQIENVFQWEAGEGSFNVSAPPDCNWTAASNAPWLSIIAGQNGTGNGTVTYRVGKNETLQLREAVITVGNRTHTLRQSRKAQLHCNLQFTPQNPQIGAGGGSGTAAVTGSSECAWQVMSNVPWLTVTSNPFGRGNGSVSFSAAVNFGGQERVGYLAFSNGSIAVTQAPNLAPTVKAGPNQTVTLPSTASLSGIVADDGIGNPVTVSWSKLSGAESVLFSQANDLETNAIFATPGVYVLRLTASDGFLTATDDVQITVNPDPTPLPPDPTVIAPPLDQTVPTNIAKATEFLYTGANPIQTGVNPADIKAERVGLLRGRVLSKNGQPLSNVKISVLDRPELGQTRSRADGMFDLVVNGGGELVLKYEKQGFISSQRQEKVDWQDYAPLDDVVLIPFDGQVSFIDLNSTAAIQTAESGLMTDADGTRRSRLFFKQGTAAVMTLPDNSTQNLTQMHVRSTEFTVGANGAETMPGNLPPTSAYTYASEYSVDEAVALDAKDITFSQPVVQYNENFLNFPVGIAVPSGAYDEETAAWVPSANGRVVKILSITNGAANLDLDGNGNPADETAYNALGINLAERQKLAEFYAVNQTLWRVPVFHFTPWDWNWGFGPPPDAEPPPDEPPQCDTCEDDECEFEGCIIGVKNQSLGEEIGLTGTSFFLRYNSERQRGRVSNRSLIIPVSNAAVPASLKSIKLTIELLGRTFEQTFPPQTNQNASFTWDGTDAYGRTVQGSQEATIKIAYVYDGVYQEVYNFASPGTGVQITGSLTRREIELIKTRTVYVSNQDSSQTGGIGGWSLSVHHVYDPNQKALFQGDGQRRSVQSINEILKNSAGNGDSGFDGDGGPATVAKLASPSGVALAPDGSYFIADSANNRIRRVSTDGIITTVVGDGNVCDPLTACGDGGQAAFAQLANPTDVAVAPDGSLYISDTDSNRIRKVAPNGIISTIVGTGEECAPTDSCGDDGMATLAKLNKPQHINLTSDGTIFIADGESRRVRRVAPDGQISTVAGSGNPNCTSDNVPARNACLGETKGVAQASDGSIYISDDNGENDRIYRVGTNGIIRIVSNAEVCNNALTEKERIGGITPLRICDPNGLVVGAGDNLYIASSFFGNVFKIDPSGNRSIVAGTTQQGLEGDGQPALQSRLGAPKGIAVAPNGNVLVAEQDGHRVRNLQSILPSFSGQDLLIPSSDGNELFQFDSFGKHLKTINALTNADKYIFGYDAAGRLLTVTDGDGNMTTIQRNGSGHPTGILSPYNQLTTLALDANGYLSAITNPADEATQFTYTSGGLLLTKRDALNNQNTFLYDAFGRLIRDEDAATGFQTVTRSQTSNSFTVTHDTSLNRVSTFKVEDLPNGDLKNTNTAPDGTQTVETEGADGVFRQTNADGTMTETKLGADPRWALLAPLEASNSINVPNVGIYDSTFSSSVTLTNPFNPLSLFSKTDIFTVNNKTYTRVFTANERTFLETSPLNRQTTTVIDPQNRPTQFQFADLNAFNLTYDTRGRLSATSSGAGAELRSSVFSYNAAGFLSATTDPLNQTNSFIYDPAGRITRQTLADTRQINFGFDANGNLTSLTPSGRPAHVFTYNSRNLVSSYIAPNVGGNSTTVYAYNLDKQITNITRPDALQINYAYDAAGRLQTLTVPNGNYGFVYNSTTGLPESISAPSGGGNVAFEYSGFLPTRQTWTGTVAGNVLQTYNNDFLVASQSVNDADTVNFTYDNDNLLTGAGNLSITRNALNGLINGSTLGNVTDTVSYNGFAEPTNYTAKFNTTTLYDVGYVRDKLGRITQKTETIGGVTTVYAYGYDSTDRLTTVTLNNAPSPLVIYGYDSNNNRTSINIGGNITNAVYDNQDRLTNYGATNFAYTLNGELQSRTTAGNTTTYNYDVIGNLRTATLPDSTNIEYLIDGQNRRIGKKVNGTLTQGFLYQDQLEPVAELDANNNIVSRFVYGMRPNTPDYLIKGGVTYRIICDQIGSVRLVVDTATGNIAQRLDYDEFGVVLLDTNPNFQPFGFAGGIYDTHTRLTRFGARDYDAETGRWTAKDPILFEAEAVNLYGYVGNDPLNISDPSGLDPTNGGGSSGGSKKCTKKKLKLTAEQLKKLSKEFNIPEKQIQSMIDKGDISTMEQLRNELALADALANLAESMIQVLEVTP